MLLLFCMSAIGGFTERDDGDAAGGGHPRRQRLDGRGGLYRRVGHRPRDGSQKAWGS